jgi:xylulokinase
MTLANLTPSNIARAAVEGLLGLLGHAIDGHTPARVEVDRVTLVGGAARSQAVSRLAPAVWGLPVEVSQ